MLDNIVELTYEQVLNRLKLLSDDYGSYLFCINTSKKYDPKPTLNINTFDFPHEKPGILCYTTPRPYEACRAHNVFGEYNRLDRCLNEKYGNQIVIIVDNTKTYSVCGVYIDIENRVVALLNGYYDGQPIDWSELEGDIY